MPIRHPCQSRCNGHLTEKGNCTGCGRSGDQIRDWNKYSEAEKESILKKIDSFNEKVAVRIKAQQTIIYDQKFEMTRGEFERIKNTTEAQMKKETNSPLSEYLSLSDSCEFGDFEAVLVESG